MFGPELTVAGSDLVNRPRRAFHKLPVALGVIEIDEGKRLVREYHRGPAVDDFMDQHFSVAQTVMKLLDVVRSAEGEIVIRQPEAWFLRAGLEFSYEIRNVETQTDIEIRLIEVSIKLKHLAPRPGFQVEIVGHGGRL